MKNILKAVVYNAIQKKRKKKLKRCGEAVVIPSKCELQGNIECGSFVKFGRGCLMVSTIARIIIHDHVIFGPNVTIYTGDHPIDVVGKHICEIKDSEKEENWDKDVIIESGCWIGTRAIILKGVTIGRGSIIGAGAVVTKDVPPYSVYVGVPQARTMQRFSNEEIERHEKMLKDRNMLPDSFSCS